MVCAIRGELTTEVVCVHSGLVSGHTKGWDGNAYWGSLVEGHTVFTSYSGSMAVPATGRSPVKCSDGKSFGFAGAVPRGDGIMLMGVPYEVVNTVNAEWSFSASAAINN